MAGILTPTLMVTHIPPVTVMVIAHIHHLLLRSRTLIRTHTLIHIHTLLLPRHPRRCTRFRALILTHTLRKGAIRNHHHRLRTIHTPILTLTQRRIIRIARTIHTMHQTPIHTPTHLMLTLGKAFLDGIRADRQSALTQLLMMLILMNTHVHQSIQPMFLSRYH